MTRFFYLRDSKNLPHACVAFNFDSETNTVSYGLSVCNKNDEFFKSRARSIAAARINQNTVSVSSEKFHDHLRLIITHLQDSQHISVKKLSKLWLSKSK